MHITDILNSEGPIFSFEFFPPKSEAAADKLFDTISNLRRLDPAYVSVTYGAGGTTRDLTRELVFKIKRETDLSVVSHLTCVGATREEIHALLEQYRDAGIQNIMALRGDPPSEQNHFVRPKGGFAYASELVAYIREYFPEMGIGVAGYPEGHPETPNRLKEIDYLKEKVDAGADYICTQMFFRNKDFYDFCDRCEIAGIDLPVLAGLMPITSRRGMMRMADLAGGTRYPARLLKALNRAETDEQFERVGIHWASEQVLDLLDHGVKGIHFYTLNKSKATLQICDSLGLASAKQLNEC